VDFSILVHVTTVIQNKTICEWWSTRNDIWKH